MHLNAAVTSLLLAGSAVALPIANPLQIFSRAATPGVVITRCTKPNVLSLAFDDGPYQYTSALVDTLDKAGAKGTFFWTGTLYGESEKGEAAGDARSSNSVLTLFQAASMASQPRSRRPMLRATRSPLTPGI
jgi:peptidoglycan/xylan/chitin deacetylase (PgdA/CDA1 family)